MCEPKNRVGRPCKEPPWLEGVAKSCGQGPHASEGALEAQHQALGEGTSQPL